MPRHRWNWYLAHITVQCCIPKVVKLLANKLWEVTGELILISFHPRSVDGGQCNVGKTDPSAMVEKG